MPPRTDLRVVLPTVACRAVSVNGSHRMRVLVLCLVIAFLALSPIRAQSASDATETVREAISGLLDDFDDFKDSEIFRQCVYGCGSENPGNEWRARIKVLQRQAMRREDIPTRLKDSIGELWQMGHARKAAELRQRIETVLEDKK